MPTTGSDQPSYDRGHAAGEVAGAITERLDSHDRHFAAINGSLKDVADATQEQARAIQRLADAQDAAARTALALAAALKAADEARQLEDAERVQRSEHAWSPVMRGMALLAGVATLIGIVSALYALSR